ncbi:hypothetical protein [Gottfriedia luciferensis]|uniref:hypothetical protein n=1 Tax=Gottfriedia luciferensis TaxID=178774 RepID=UPI0020C7F0C4|nr:hypothetical protein [Gottfriedia luciferensis]
MHSLGGIRNAQRLLKSLVEMELLSVTKWTNEHVYYLSKNGASYVGTNPMKKSIQIDHHLLRNEAWMMSGLPKWDIEKPITFSSSNGDKKQIIPDARFKADTLYCIEIDRKQSMVRNRKKMELYGILNELFYIKNQKKIVLRIYTTLNSRKILFENLAGEHGVVCEVYVLDDI